MFKGRSVVFYLRMQAGGESRIPIPERHLPSLSIPNGVPKLQIPHGTQNKHAMNTHAPNVNLRAVGLAPKQLRRRICGRSTLRLELHAGNARVAQAKIYRRRAREGTGYGGKPPINCRFDRCENSHPAAATPPRSLSAAPLIKVKFAVKSAVRCCRNSSRTALLTVIFTLARTRGAALSGDYR